MDAVINFQKCINKPNGDGVGRLGNVLKLIWFKNYSHVCLVVGLKKFLSL